MLAALLVLAFFNFGWVSAKALASGLAVKPHTWVMAKAGKVAVGLVATIIRSLVIHGVPQLWGRSV